MGADLTTMPRLVCIPVAILMLAMSFALAESNSWTGPAPNWITACKTAPICPKECKSGDASHTVCEKVCAHKWEHTSNKGPYMCKDKKCSDAQKKDFKNEKFWCPTQMDAQFDAAKALQLIKGAHDKNKRNGKFPVQWKKWSTAQKEEHKTSPVKYELKAKDCMPSNVRTSADLESIKPVPLKFMINEPHRKYKSDSKKFMTGEPRTKMKTSWSRRGHGMEMYPWVTPGVSQCSPDTATDFIDYFEDLKLYGHAKDKIGEDCYRVSRRKGTSKGHSIGKGTAEALRKAGRCKFNIAGKKFCAFEQSFFCAKKITTKETEVYEKVRVDKMKRDGKEKDGKPKYFYLKLGVTFSARKANMCERMWRHLPYTCSVKKITLPIVTRAISCGEYDGGKGRKSDNSGAPPKALCDHYKKYYPTGHHMAPNPIAIEDFAGAASLPGKWKGFKRTSPSILLADNIEAAARAFVTMN